MAKKPKDGRGQYERKAGVHTFGEDPKSLTFIVTRETANEISKALESRGIKQADWLREATQEKLDRDG